MRGLLNKRYILTRFVFNAMALLETKCFEAFNFFVYMFNEKGFVQHSRIFL